MGLKERLAKLEGNQTGSTSLLIIETSDYGESESAEQTLSRLKAERGISETALVIWN